MALSSSYRPDSDKVNRQISVRYFKNVDYFAPLHPVISHVDTTFLATVSDNGDMIIKFSNCKSVTDNGSLIKIGMWVGHEKHRIRNTLKVKTSKVTAH